MNFPERSARPPQRLIGEAAAGWPSRWTTPTTTRSRPLFDQVRRDQGRLDILVNNAFALPDDLTDPKPFWEKPLSNWGMVEVGVRSNFVAAWHAAHLTVPARTGLIVATFGYTGMAYTYGVIFGVCKSAVDRMARDMAVELQPHNVASLSLWPGLTYTERAQRNLAADPGMKNATVTDPAVGSSVGFPGRSSPRWLRTRT
jgi:NAD(P)-dependent dehydrogenase (short-subunit alcohol dehydrogenase family)